MFEIYLIVLLSVLIAYSPFIKKILLKTFSSIEIMCLEHLFYTIPLIIFIVYRLCLSKPKLKFFKKITKKHIGCLSLMTLSTIVVAILYYYVINHLPVSKVVPVLSPLIIIFSILIGVSLFKETIDISEIFGICLIVSGIYVSKSKNVKTFLNKLLTYIHTN